jgi:hypothetical protein
MLFHFEVRNHALEEQLIKQWISGKTRVTGTYCGQQVTGTVMDGRGFPRGNKTQLDVKLDAPITVFGDVRTTVVLTDDNQVSEVAAQ